jgi:cell shape-determining protein MreD
MKVSWRVVLVTSFLVTLHFFLRLGLGIGSIAPDLLTLAMLVAARELRTGSAAAVGVFLGVLEDSFSILAFGGSTVAMAVIGVVGSRTRDLFVGDSLVFLVSYLVLGKWSRDLIQWLVVGEGVREPFVDTMLIQAPVSAIYLAVVGVLAVAATGSWWETTR